MEGKDFPDAGNCLYDLIIKSKNTSDKIVIDLEGVTSLPSMFLNVSIGRYIEEFGLDSLKQISFIKITKSQAQRMSEYISKIRESIR
jgi:hypothetical protein